MRVSQLLHAMDKEAWVCIDDFGEHIDRMTLYTGTVRGIKRDSPINRMHVSCIFADGDVIRVLAEKQRKEGERYATIHRY